MILRRLATCMAFAALVAFPALGNDLTLPERARLSGDRVSSMDSYALPVGSFAAGNVATREFEGRIERQSFRMIAAGVSTLQVLTPLREQIAGLGYNILFECRDVACGGFDFRFGIEVVPAPDMHVNIRDFRYLGAVRGKNEALSLLISRTGDTIYIQTIHTAPLNPEPGQATSLSDPVQQVLPDQPQKLVEALQARGHVVLRDLIFETGATRLGEGPFASLQQLAGFLEANPSLRIALVGHTDSVGPLSNNISLSKRRAGSVRARMTGKYGIAPARIEAEGMGYLAPVASNLTRAGREENRRVEAILLSN